MPYTTTINSIVFLGDIATPIMLVSAWYALKRTALDKTVPVMLSAALVLVLVWGSIWAWVPAVSAYRFQPPPLGQASAILGAIAALCSLLFVRTIRQFLINGHFQTLIALGPWRIFFGGMLLWSGILGGLPPEFFWSSAFGDIFVGCWAILVLLQRKATTERQTLTWNIVGLLDLIHVLVLGASTLQRFYVSHPAIPPMNLLPLVGVPVFLTIHVFALWALLARRGFALVTAQQN